MKPEEYVKTIVYNGHMVNVGLDDAGQQYFLEYVSADGELVEYECGSYNMDYQYVIERIFGNPEQCAVYGNEEKCATPLAHGYCHDCKYGPWKAKFTARHQNK